MRRLPPVLLSAAACLLLVPDGLAQRGGRPGSGGASRATSTISSSRSGGSIQSGARSSRSGSVSSGRSSGPSFQGSSPSRSGGFRAPVAPPSVGRAPSPAPSPRPVTVPTAPSRPSFVPPSSYAGRPSPSLSPSLSPGPTTPGRDSGSLYTGRAPVPTNRVLEPRTSAPDQDDSARYRYDDRSTSSRAGGSSAGGDELDRVFVDLSGTARSPRVPFPRSYASTVYGRRAATDDRLEAIAGRGSSGPAARVGADPRAGAAPGAPSLRFEGTGYTAADRARQGGPRAVEPGARGDYARGPLDRLAYPRRSLEDIARGAPAVPGAGSRVVPERAATAPRRTADAPSAGLRPERPASGERLVSRAPTGSATREGIRELAERDPDRARSVAAAGRAMARAQGAALEVGVGAVIGAKNARLIGGSLYTVPPHRTGTGGGKKTDPGWNKGYPYYYPYCGGYYGKSYFSFGIGFYFGKSWCYAYTPYFWCWYYPYWYYRYWYPSYYPYYWAYYPSYPSYPAAYYGGIVYNYYYGDYGGTTYATGETYYEEPVGEAVGGRVARDYEEPATASLNSAAERYLTLGDRAFREGRFNDAVTFYAKAIEFAPDHGVLYLILADALFATGDYHYAAYAIRRALELDPSLIDSVVDKHAFYADPAEFDRQLAVLENFVADHPADSDARFVLATNFLFGDRPAAAVDLLEGPFTEALRTDPAAQLVLAAARALQYGDLNALQPAGD